VSLLEVRNIHKHFGGVAALNGADLDVVESEILGIIGPNGAGKSTLFNVITGFYQPAKGRVIYQGKDITGLRPHQIARKGIARTFQDLSLFCHTKVSDSILTAYHRWYQTGLFKAFLHTKGVRAEEEYFRQQVSELMEFMGLTPYKDKYAIDLSSGYQKALSIAIAFAANPKLLLLDEPVTTLSEDKVEMVMSLVSRVRNAGTTVVIIEHNMKAIMNYCDRIAVLTSGKKLAEGRPQDIRENSEVIEAYLGVTI